MAAMKQMLRKHDVLSPQAISMPSGALSQALDMLARKPSLEPHKQRNPILVIEPDGRVLYANDAAHQMLGGQFSLKLKNGRLHMPGGKLKDLLKSTIDSLENGEPSPLRAIALPQSAGGEPLILHAAVVNPEHTFPGTAGKVAFICILNRGRDLERNELLLLRQAFGFSKAETEILSLILAGFSPREIAKHRSSSEQTVRWHIKNIHSKTNTRRLTDLVLQMQIVRSPF